jgi:RND family efflux transporter MFP subunit
MMHTPHMSFRRSTCVLLSLLLPASPALAIAGPDAMQVGVAQAHMIKMSPKIALPGTVVSRNDSHLASEVDGRVSWVADVGDVVKKGDVIARLDSNLAQMQYHSDTANVARLSASLRYDEAQATRMQTLMNSNAIAASTRDQAVSQRDVDTAQLAQARSDLAKSKFTLDHSQIRAPFPGRVVARLINAGEFATAGKEIVRLVDVNDIEVKSQVPIESAHFLREGMPVTVQIEHRPLIARTRAIVPVGDESSRTIEIRLTLKPGDALVGDAAKVFLPSSTTRNVLAIPRDALVLREDNTYVFKIGPKSTAQRVAVETGSEDGAMIEVKGAIGPGDKVVVQGAERLEAGQKVHPIGAS